MRAAVAVQMNGSAWRLWCVTYSSIARIRSGETPKGAAANPLARDLGEPAFDQVEPRGAGRHEVAVIPRMGGEPSLDRRMRVRAVVVENQMNLAPLRHGAIDLIQERQELGVAFPRRAAREDRPVQDVQRGKQVGGAVPNVVMRLARWNARAAAAAPARCGRAPAPGAFHRRRTPAPGRADGDRRRRHRAAS